MLIHKAFKYELSPTPRQEVMFRKTAGCARHVYNWALNQAGEIRSQSGKLPSFKALSRMVTQHKNDQEFDWLNEVQAVALFDSVKDLHNAFQRFFSKKARYPAFKKKGRRDSFTIARNKKEAASILVDGRHFRIPKIGIVRTKEKVSIAGTALNATVSREADRWFIAVACEVEIPTPRPVDGPAVGIDVGLIHFAVLSDGTKIEAPRPLAAHLRRLKRIQRQHSKKRKGSANRRKSALRISRLHWRIKNIRNDFAHKLSTHLAKTKSVIAVENLKIQNMQKNEHLARSISDVSWYAFTQMLDYKTKWYGSRLVRADAWYPSSKICSACGFKIESLPLRVRTWTCPSCEAQHDRDVNAAKNLEKIAYESTAGQAESDACGV